VCVCVYEYERVRVEYEYELYELEREEKSAALVFVCCAWSVCQVMLICRFAGFPLSVVWV